MNAKLSAGQKMTVLSITYTHPLFFSLSSFPSLFIPLFFISLFFSLSSFPSLFYPSLFYSTPLHPSLLYPSLIYLFLSPLFVPLYLPLSHSYSSSHMYSFHVHVIIFHGYHPGPFCPIVVRLHVFRW